MNFKTGHSINIFKIILIQFLILNFHHHKYLNKFKVLFQLLTLINFKYLFY